MEYAHQILLQIVKGFVNHPEAVESHLSEDTDEKGEIVLINIKVHKEDIGSCIGVEGQTAEAIRKIVGVVGFKQTNGKRVYVKIDAPKIPKTHFQYS
jgi:predicted RNA-binding protein YlqC (UPF0109 family)